MKIKHYNMILFIIDTVIKLALIYERIITEDI